ncbi:hypothetical protein CDD83_6344 [Cordyceps sp. RAO-2017]|nr:hypothetical protein CDD83_6344 [Cordyceps sp. RAO-2017]
MEPDMESEYDFLATRRGLERLYLGPESDDASSVEKLLIKYPAKLHARRVAAELGVDDGLVYLQGQPEAELRDSDQSVPFRQRRYFFYVSGANFADCHATYCIASDQLTLWIPHVEPKDVLWFGTKPSPEQCMELYDVSEVRYASELAEFVGRYGGRIRATRSP